MRGDGGGSSSRLVAVRIGVSATNGQTPVTSSYNTTPNAYTSVAGVTAPPSTCSGAMYSGVPEISATSDSDNENLEALSLMTPPRQTEIGHDHSRFLIRDAWPPRA